MLSSTNFAASVLDSTNFDSLEESQLKRKLDDVDNSVLSIDECLNDTQRARRDELESFIEEHMAKGNYFQVGLALREIDELQLYGPDKTVYGYAKTRFSFSRRTANTYLCAASVYKSLKEDPYCTLPLCISHVRSLHKYSPEVRRLIWRQVCESKVPITEEEVIASTIKYETGAIFSDLANEFYTPNEIILAGKRVINKTAFDLDPASCHYANNLYENGIAPRFYDETIDGLSQKWFGDCWLSPPNGYDKSGASLQSIWFLNAEAKYISGEILSCHILLRSEFGNSWFLRAINYPHCYFREKLQFTTPTGKNKCRQDDDFILVYIGNNVNSFCSQFNTMGIIPGFNAWAYRPQSANVVPMPKPFNQSIPLPQSIPQSMPPSTANRDPCNKVVNSSIRNNGLVNTTGESMNCTTAQSMYLARKFTLPKNSHAKINSSSHVMPDAFGLGFTQFHDTPSSMYTIPGIPIIYPRAVSNHSAFENASCTSTSNLSEKFLESPLTSTSQVPIKINNKHHDPGSLLIQSSLNSRCEAALKKQRGHYNTYTDAYSIKNDTSRYTHSPENMDFLKNSTAASLSELSSLYGLGTGTGTSNNNNILNSLNLPFDQGYFEQPRESAESQHSNDF